LSTPLAVEIVMTERHDLLPGVSPEVPEPVVVFASAAVIRRARLRALGRDLFDLTLLIAVDVFFIRWPYARVPLLDRPHSLALLVGMNLVLIAYVWTSRTFPRWRARRMAGTWCNAERERLTSSLRSRASR
jgi:hypothetical protein